MSTRKFFRTVYQVEVLSGELIEGGIPIEHLAYQIDEGDYSGSITITSEEVDGPTMARMLVAQGSDPGFFQLDADGEEVEG